jgi:hypothetical protein
MKALRQILDTPVHTPESLAKKHGVSVEAIHHQLQKGIKAESEHTSHEEAARRIALAHVAEKPNYYDLLDKYVE